MGKSPGKWIKTVLFGKKPSKSSTAKGREKFTHEKEAPTNKTYEENLVPDPPIASHTVRANLSKSEGGVELDNEENENVLDERQISLQDNQGSQMQGLISRDSTHDPEKLRLEQAATKAQAAFRGYLARRAFWALKGIIRLQALIRGHLVRRKAVATLCCMYGIVKLQALIRGRMVRSSDIKKSNLPKPVDGMPVKQAAIDISTKIVKLSANAFVHKLLASSPKAVPLHLEDDHVEPNSVPNWLEIWSRSCFWKPLSQPKKISDNKPQRKQTNVPTLEPQTGKSKRSIRKLPIANVDTTSVHATFESEKPKRSVRKASSQLVDSVQENPQIELEKVKRSLRKVYHPVVENAIQSEVETETTNQRAEKPVVTSSDDTRDQLVCDSSENTNKEAAFVMSNVLDVEATPEHLMSTDSRDKPNNDQGLNNYMLSSNIAAKEENIPGDQTAEAPSCLAKSSSKHEESSIINGEVDDEETGTGNESQKPGRKASTPAKVERADNGSQHCPTLPSYMAATESAKAKLRAQGSPRFGLESSEKNNVARRHSLPSANGKLSSHSPRTQRPVQVGGKGGNRTDRSSRDGNGKVAQVEWRR